MANGKGKTSIIILYFANTPRFAILVAINFRIKYSVQTLYLLFLVKPSSSLMFSTNALFTFSS